MAKSNLSNLVKRDALRKVQRETLEQIHDVISNTAGPYGSYSMIMHNDQLTDYSKDGHKVLSNFKFYRPLEASIHDELIGITDHVIKKVGDGTTTAIQLSHYIFNSLCDYEDKWKEEDIRPYRIIEAFQKIVKQIIKQIKKQGRELTIDDIYQICLISTNGNEMVSRDIANLYKKYGKDLYIQLNTSNTESSIEKIYDGMVLSKGMSSASFVNTDDNTCELYNPHIYYFPDPVDTPEMIQLFMTIFTENIYMPYSQRTGQYIPTLILAPSVSQDVASSLNDIEQIMYGFDKDRSNKPPFCIITGINDHVDNIGDIITLCGCPMIKKYINADQRVKDIEDGKAPSMETITTFYGKADKIVVDMDKCKIINPKEMFDNDAPVAEDGSRPFSNTYNSLVSFLKKEIEKEELDKSNLNKLFALRRRLHFLSANFVEYCIGGVSAADRGSVKDLAEDAILNCRSAVAHGVGQGACIEGYIAAQHIQDNIRMKAFHNDKLELDADIIGIIVKSYHAVIYNLYSSGLPEKEVKETINKSQYVHKAYNLREQTFDGPEVLCSIETDVCILEAISKIITIMYSANQAFLIDPLQNAYQDDNVK